MTPEEYEKYEDEQAALLGVFGPEAQSQSQAQVKARTLAVALERERAELAPFRFEEWHHDEPRVYAPWPWCPHCEAAIESPAEGWRCPECEAKLTPSAQELGRVGGLP